MKIRKRLNVVTPQQRLKNSCSRETMESSKESVTEVLCVAYTNGNTAMLVEEKSKQ